MKLLRVPEVVALTGLSRWTLDRLVKSRGFPPKYRIGGGIGWNEDDVVKWINNPPLVKSPKSKKWVRK